MLIPDIWPRKATMLIEQNFDWFAIILLPATQSVRRLPMAWQMGAAGQSFLLLKLSNVFKNASSSFVFIWAGVSLLSPFYY